MDKLQIVLQDQPSRRQFLARAAASAGLALGASGLTSLLGGCTPEEAPGEVTELFNLYVRLGWIKNAEFAYLFAAQEKGYFEEEGLETEVFTGGSGIDPVRLVAAGGEQIGIASSGTHLISARSEGIPVKVFAAYAQQHPNGFLSLKGSGITSCQDFAGKRLGTQTENLKNVEAALAKCEGVSVDDVEIVSAGYDATPLLSGQVDIYTAWIVNQPYQVEKAGEEWNFIKLWDLGLQFYALNPFTTDEFLAENPDVVDGFLRASLKGLQDVLDDPAEGAELTVKYGEGELEDEKWLLDQLNPLCVSDATEEYGLGWMRKEVWESGRDSLLETEVIDKSFDIDDLVTLEPLRRVHGIS